MFTGTFWASQRSAQCGTSSQGTAVRPYTPPPAAPLQCHPPHDCACRQARTHRSLLHSPPSPFCRGEGFPRPLHSRAPASSLLLPPPLLPLPPPPLLPALPPALRALPPTVRRSELATAAAAHAPASATADTASRCSGRSAGGGTGSSSLQSIKMRKINKCIYIYIC